MLGNPALACTHMEHTIALYDPAQHHGLTYRYGGIDIGIAGFSMYAWALWMRGYPAQARTHSDKALSLAQQLAHPYSLARTLHYDTVLCQLRRDAPGRPRPGRRGNYRGHGPEIYPGAGLLGSSCVAGPSPCRSTALRVWCRYGRVSTRTGRSEQNMHRPHFLSMLAEASGLLGQPEGGLAALEEALTLMEQTGERYYEAELHRQRGELLLLRAVQSHPARGSRAQHEAEACFQHALDVSRQQQAKSLELRAAMSLARLWQQQDKRAAAYDLLTPIYGWFTEGFDTADLQEARALLEVLA